MCSRISLRLSPLKFLALLLLWAGSEAQVPAQQVKDLKPQGYVSDFAGVLDAVTKEKLAALCAELDRKANAQIAVVTVASLGGEPVEQFSIELATQWGVGPKQQARGVMILLAPAERQYRIEVGYGLEPILPDGKVGGFGREAVPLLRQNNYAAALLLLTSRVASTIAADRGITLDSLSGLTNPPAESVHIAFPSATLIWFILIALFILFPVGSFLLRLLFGVSLLSSRRRRGGWIGGPWYGGGAWGGGGSSGGGGFGRGGGFGGFGGGSFGGGGASGSW
jgi:uncharacterized protein